MVDFSARQRLGPQSRALHYSYEKAGLVLDNQPIPWNAEAVLIEFQCRAPSGRRAAAAGNVSAYQREDFTLRLAGDAQPLPAESLKQECPELCRVFFRCGVPRQNALVEIAWRGHSLGQLQLPVLQPADFLQYFALDLPMVSVQLEPQTVPCQAVVTTQCHGVVLSALASSATSLVPIVDLGLCVRMVSDRGDVCAEVPLSLSHAQLRSRQALLALMMPKPRRTGDWAFQWLLGGKVLAEQKLRTLTAAGLYQSLRVSATRFVVQYEDGRTVPALSLRSLDGVARAGPCFFVASSLPGLAGWCDLEVRARLTQQASAQEQPVHRQKVLVSDGPTPVLAGTLDLENLRHIKHFELRCRNRLLGLLPVEDVPTANFTSEGGFTPPENFPWSHAAESELQEKLNRLLANK